MTSGEVRKIDSRSLATIGVLSNPDQKNIKIGKALPHELHKMESETMVRVAEVKIDNKSYIIPRSNLEMLEID